MDHLCTPLNQVMYSNLFLLLLFSSLMFVMGILLNFFADNITGLASIFHLNSTNGLLTVNATGPHLVGAGIPLGLIVVSI